MIRSSIDYSIFAIQRRNFEFWDQLKINITLKVTFSEYD